MSTPSITRLTGRLVLAAVGLAASASCAGELATTGKSPAFLIIDSLSAASGAASGVYGSFLNSDVITNVETQIDGVAVQVPTVFNDPGRAVLRLGLKNPGTTVTPTSPNTLNEITVTRYRVVFKRADGRNTPGVDVPYGFDGGVTGTVGAETAITLGFELVRHTMKQEPPLKNLINMGGSLQISTIAEVTFYGRDQAGNEVSVTGLISVNFADFGDPS